jgi:uncharacterized protein YebE (UPF0316 family)
MGMKTYEKGGKNMSKLFLIIFVQLLYVPMLTLRTICMVKNLKIVTSIFGFLEALIYIFGLSVVLSGEQSVVEMLVYAFGFALGIVVGIKVEQKLAIGYSSMHVNINHMNEELITILRNKGFGVTAYSGEGKFGERKKLDVLTNRKRENELIQLIYQYEPEAFVMAFEPKMFRGGYLTEIMKNRMETTIVNNINSKDESKNVVKRMAFELKKEIKKIKNW